MGEGETISARATIAQTRIQTVPAPHKSTQKSTSPHTTSVMYPWTYGVLGVVGGPLLMGAAFLINWQCTRWTIQAARATHSTTLGGLGEALYGAKGRMLMEIPQLLFQQLFLPVAIVLSASALQSLAGNVREQRGVVPPSKPSLLWPPSPPSPPSPPWPSH